MKLISTLLLLCSYTIFCRGQLSLPESTNNKFGAEKKFNDEWKSWYSNGQLLDSGFMQRGIPDGTWLVKYQNGATQFIRTYSKEKWQQFQNEKIRYHPKRISMVITKLFHGNKTKAEQYTTAINTFCAKQNCPRDDKEDIPQIINNNSETEHYHPLFENGLLHGLFINYFSDGAIKDSGLYRNGLPEDLWIKWTDDKKFYWKGFYKHGLKNNEWKLYSAIGKLIRIDFFHKGKYLWRKEIKEGVVVLDEDGL
jgi:antitoxin component YwqK of YwqJK toxin-antitoxin module